MTPDELMAAQNTVFMALTVWREARSESTETQTAVAWVIKTRTDNPGWWGIDVMTVCFQPWQFSSMTFPHDPQLATWPVSGGVVAGEWDTCMEIADGVLSGQIGNPVPGATHYHDVSIGQPAAWGNKVTFLKQLGRLKFYKVA